MKRETSVFVAIALIGLLLIIGCQPSVTEEHTPISVKDMNLLQQGQEATVTCTISVIPGEIQSHEITGLTSDVKNVHQTFHAAN